MMSPKYQHAAFKVCVCFMAAFVLSSCGGKDDDWGLLETDTLKLDSDRSRAIPKFSQDGSLIAIPFSRTIRLWDLKKESVLTKITTERHSTSVAFSSDGGTLVWGETNPEEEKSVYLRFFDIGTLKRTGEILCIKGGGNVRTIEFSANGDSLAVKIGGRGVVQIWDVKEKSLQHTFGTLDRNELQIISLALDPRSGLLATGAVMGDQATVVLKGGNSRILFWDTSTGKQKRKFRGHKGWITILAFSSDGRWLVSACELVEKELFLWDVESGKTLWEWDRKKLRDLDIEELSSVSFSPDGSKLAVSTLLGDIKLFDVPSGRLLGAVRATQVAEDRLRSVVFHPKNDWLISRSQAHLKSWKLKAP